MGQLGILILYLLICCVKKEKGRDRRATREEIGGVSKEKKNSKFFRILFNFKKEKEKKAASPEELLKDIPTDFLDRGLAAWAPAIRAMEILIWDYYRKKNGVLYDDEFKRNGTFN